MDSKEPMVEEQKKKGAGRDLLLSLGGLLVFVLIGLGVIAASDPGGSGLSFLSQAPKARSALEMTLLHTNDTWGYIETCGG
jgi:hypothetical protein